MRNRFGCFNTMRNCSQDVFTAILRPRQYSSRFNDSYSSVTRRLHILSIQRVLEACRFVCFTIQHLLQPATPLFVSSLLYSSGPLHQKRRCSASTPAQPPKPRTLGSTQKGLSQAEPGNPDCQTEQNPQCIKLPHVSPACMQRAG